MKHIGGGVGNIRKWRVFYTTPMPCAGNSCKPMEIHGKRSMKEEYYSAMC
jgi:hypothetical protein